MDDNTEPLPEEGRGKRKATTRKKAAKKKAVPKSAAKKTRSATGSPRARRKKAPTRNATAATPQPAAEEVQRSKPVHQRQQPSESPLSNIAFAAGKTVARLSRIAEKTTAAIEDVTGKLAESTRKLRPKRKR